MMLPERCMGCMETIEPGTKICPHCGFDQAHKNQPNQLPYTILNGKYQIGRVLGQGGFGITYVGYDLNLLIKVAVKEYYPKDTVDRTSGMGNTVRPLSAQYEQDFERGKQRFLKEAQIMAGLRNMSSIVRVYDFFSEHGTVYYVMDFVEGETLLDQLIKTGKKSYHEMLAIFGPLMMQLDEIHKRGLEHC